MKRSKKYPTTETFIFTNTNPKGLLTTGDCVIRAISIATGKEWKEVVMGLAETACETSFSPLSRENYDVYLTRNGWKKMPMPKHENGTKYTAKEFCKEHKTGTFVCNIAGHTFCVKNGRVHDTWDVSKFNKRLGNYWKQA